MKILSFIFGVGIILILTCVIFAVVWNAYMTRYRQMLRKKTDDELKNEADRLYGKIAMFSAFFEFGQNYKRYEAVLDEMETRGLCNAS